MGTPGLNPDQAIQALRGLPEDRQRAILGRLSPDEKQGIMAKLSAPPQPVSPPIATPEPMQPEARTLGNYASEGIRGIGRGIENDVQGIGQVLTTNPVKTFSALRDQASQSVSAAQKAYADTDGTPGQKMASGALGLLENAPIIGGMVQHAEQGGSAMGSPEAFGAAMEGTTSFEAPGAAGKLVGPMVNGLRATSESFRNAAQSATGAGAKTVAYKVGQEADAANAARESTLANNKAATEGTLKDMGKVDDANAAQAQKDADARQKIRESNANADAKTLEDRARVDAANADQLRKDAESKQKVTESNANADAGTLEDRAKVDAINEANAKKDAAKLAEVKQQNQQARDDFGRRQKAESDLEDAHLKLQSQIETARNNALKEGNKKYNAVNSTLNNFSADNEAIQDGYHEALSKIAGTQSSPPILKSIGDRLQSMNEGHAGGFDYSDLQGYYSELGREIAKGNLAGDVYQAMDTMHEAIGNDMQRIADTQGSPIDASRAPRRMVDGSSTDEPAYRTDVGKDLYDARNYWRRMKQSFGKGYNPTDVGNATLQKVTGLGPEVELKNRIRLLSSFDPEISNTAAHANNLRSTIDSISAKPPVDQPLPQPTARLPYAEPRANSTVPKSGPQSQYTQPEPNRPLPPPTPPRPYPLARSQEPIVVPTVDTQAMRNQLIDRWSRGEEGMSKFQIHRLMSGGIGAVVGGLLDGSVGAGVGGALGGAFGPMAVSKVVDMPSVRAWLKRPPIGELEALRRLPNADRIRIVDGLSKVAKQAQSKGVNVSPLIGVALRMGSNGDQQQPTP